MFGHWYVVANQRGARVLSEISNAANPRGVKQFKLIRAFENPLGKLKTRELIHQEKGVGVKSLGRFGSFARYAEAKRRNPHELAAEQFARQIVEYLQKERRKKTFSDLIVVAEPHFLGKLRAAMNPPIERKVSKWIRKDLQKLSRARLTKMLPH